MSVAVDLGDLRRVAVRSGCDRQSYTEIFCDHGRISLTSTELLGLIDESREALVAAAAKKGRR